MACASSTIRSCATIRWTRSPRRWWARRRFPSRSLAMVLVNLNGLGVNTDAANVMGRLIGNADSIRNYYLYDSYGMQDINAQVFGPINYTMTTCSNTDAGKLSHRPAPDDQRDVPALPLVHRQTNGGSPCTWGGLGSVGSPTEPARDTWYNGSSSCVVLVQEPGHNFGMQHSSTLACGSGARSSTIRTAARSASTATASIRWAAAAAT